MEILRCPFGNICPQFYPEHLGPLLFLASSPTPLLIYSPLFLQLGLFLFTVVINVFKLVPTIMCAKMPQICCLCFDFFLFACLLCFESRTRLVSWCRGGSGAFSFCLFLAWYTIHPVTPSPPSPPPLCLPLLMFRSWGGSGAFLFYFSISFSLPDTCRGGRGV